MNCRDSAERITALVDGELPPAEREELERHLSACAPCREARAAEEAVAARLRAAPRPALPAGFSAAVMEKVGARRPKGRVLPLWPLLAAASAVAAAVVAMVVIGPGARPGAPVLTARAPAAEKKPAAATPPKRLDREAGNERAAEAGKAAGAKFEDTVAPPPVATPAGPAVPEMDPALPEESGLLAAVEKDASDRKETKKADAADKPRADEEARKEPEQEARASTRIALQYKVPVLADAQQSVEGALLANRGLATRGGAWTVPLEGKVRQEQNRVLLLQVRPENLEKLQAVLDRAFPPKDSTVQLLDRGEVLPPEVARLLADRRFGARLGDLPTGGKMKAPGDRGAAPAPVPPPDSGGGGAPGPEPGPPPKPSAEQLRKLAEPPPPAKEGPTTVVGESAEVLVEIHLETAPVEKR